MNYELKNEAFTYNKEKYDYELEMISYEASKQNTYNIITK